MTIDLASRRWRTTMPGHSTTSTSSAETRSDCAPHGVVYVATASFRERILRTWRAGDVAAISFFASAKAIASDDWPITHPKITISYAVFCLKKKKKKKKSIKHKS